MLAGVAWRPDFHPAQPKGPSGMAGSDGSSKFNFFRGCQTVSIFFFNFKQKHTRILFLYFEINFLIALKIEEKVL